MGILYVVALPIGNLKDITLRALEVLKEVDLVLTEDTRSFKKLEKAYKLPPKKVISFYKEVEASKEDQIIAWLKEGKRIALCSEAGTPLLSDPGGKLIRRVLLEGFNTVPIPGPSSLTAAASISPIDLSQGFIFLGFLPKKEKEIKERLENLPPDLPLLLFIPPHRFHKTLAILIKYLGDREAFLARELTKRYEELCYTSLRELLKREEIKGEITLIVGKRTNKEEVSPPVSIDLEKIKKEMRELMKLKLKPKEIAKRLREKYGLSTKVLYEWIKELKG